MGLWTDDDLFALVRRELFTSVVGEVRDKLHLSHRYLPPVVQSFLEPAREALEGGSTAVEASEKFGIM